GGRGAMVQLPWRGLTPPLKQKERSLAARVKIVYAPSIAWRLVLSVPNWEPTQPQFAPAGHGWPTWASQAVRKELMSPEFTVLSPLKSAMRFMLLTESSHAVRNELMSPELTVPSSFQSDEQPPALVPELAISS